MYRRDREKGGGGEKEGRSAGQIAQEFCLDQEMVCCFDPAVTHADMFIFQSSIGCGSRKD